MTRFVKFLVILATTTALAATPALAVIKRITGTGTVSGGIDTLAIFGTADGNLSGKSFSISYIYDTSLGEYVNDGEFEFFFSNNGMSPILSST
ncbi:MAG: hypothetical protein ACOYKQ_11630, partial [Polymorphobacter sp.]